MSETSKTDVAVKTVMDNTRIKTAVVGVGNGGGQVAMAAVKNLHNVLVLNTSVKDLDDSVLSEDVNAIRIGDGRGSGKDRDNAMALLKSKGMAGVKEIFENSHFKSTVDPADVVIVAFSTGGGTGSGIGPYLAGLIKKAYKTKLVIPFGILPKESESVMAQANTIACVDDMTKLDLPYMLADLEYYRDEPMEVAYEKIGTHVAECINVIRGDYLRMSSAGMADERDIMTVISQPGYMAIHFARGIMERDLTNKTIQGYLIDKIKASPTCRSQRDGVVVYNCLIVNTNPAIEDPMKNGDYAELNSYIGEPKATFGNYAIMDDQVETDVISIMTGLSLPMDRFISCRAKVKANKEKYEQASKFNLSGDREAATFAANAQKNIIMGSQSSGGADLSFLDEE